LQQNLIYGQSSGGQEWLFRRGTSQTSVYLRTRLKLSAAEGVREAVLAGQGFAISSRWMFGPEPKSGEVLSVLEEWTLPAMDLCVIYYASGRWTSAKARAFVKWFEGVIQTA
jgi:DNA-binding transcriptional LysR family regulator